MNRAALFACVSAVSAAMYLPAVTRADDEPRGFAAPGVKRSVGIATGDAAERGTAVSVTGTVRDPAGQPVAGATAWLITGALDSFDPPDEASSFADGRFVFDDVDEQRLTRVGRLAPTVIVRDEKGRLGWYRFLAFSNTRSRQWHGDLRLRDLADLPGRVSNAEGKPVARVKVTCEAFFESRKRDTERTSPTSSVELPPALAAAYTAITDDDGRFALVRVPTGVRVRCRLMAPGVADAQVVFEAGELAEVRLGAPGSIAGSLVFPDGTERNKFSYQLQIVSKNEPNEKAGGLPLKFSKVLSVDASGVFRFDGLPPGRYTISPVTGQDASLFAEATAPLELTPGQHLADVAIELKKAQHVRGSVIDGETGKGVEFVELFVQVLGTQDSRKVVTDAEGRFSAWVRPGKARVQLYEVPNHYVPPPSEQPDYREVVDGESPTIELATGAVLEGIVVDEAGQPVSSAHLNIKLDRVRLTPSYVPQRANRWGKFTVGRLQRGQSLTLRARSADAVTDGATSVTMSRLGAAVTLTVAARHACRVTGQVADNDGTPLPWAQVSVTARRRQDLAGNSFTFIDTVVDIPTLDQDGRFQSEALWGDDNYLLTVEADGYGRLTTDIVATVPGKVCDFGTLVLHKASMLEGQIVGDTGQPVPNADLRVHIGSLRRTQTFASTADGAGRFGFEIDHDAVVAIWARSGAAVSNGAAVTLASRLRAPVTIPVSEAFAFRYTGKVVDRRGQPVDGAVVHVVWIEDPQRGGGQAVTALRQGKPITLPQFHVSECRVADDGTFVSEPLWPDLHYNVIALAEGCQTWESPTLLGEFGQTCDLGNIVLNRGRLSVSGRVIDADSRPVAGAAVTNSGDTDKPLGVETAADGTFRLEGLPDGPVFLLIRKASYRPTGARRDAGDAAFEIVLLDESKPRAASNQPLAIAPSDEELLVVRRGLEQLWKLRDRFQITAGRRGRRSGDVAQLIECMASIDLEQALRWSAAENGNYDDQARLAAAKRVASESVDEALLLAEVPNELAEHALHGMASRRLAAGARDDALRLLRAELVPRQTRGRLMVRPYDSVMTRARIGRMALKAGADDWGRRLIADIADEIENHVDDEQSSQARAAVAEALAAVDPPRAMRLWRTLPRQQAGYVSDHDWRIAAALAADDLPDARKILEVVETEARGDLRGSSGATERARTAMAYELARTSVDAALALLDEKPFAAAGAKAEALSWVAVALAGRDKPRAWQLIDRAFELCLENPETGNVGFTGGRPLNAARIAIKARKIGYPDMRSLVDRVLAVRSTPQELPSAVMLAESTLTVARLLALIEPKLARDLLVSIEPQAPLLGTGRGRIKRSDWLVGWALVDLDRAQELFAEELAAQRRQPTPELGDSGLLPMLEVLALPPDERAGYLERELVYSFVFPISD